MVSSYFVRAASLSLTVVLIAALGGCGGLGVSPTLTDKLSVSLAGTGVGAVISSPTGINCGSTCSATFDQNTSVTLTASPASGSAFAGWSGACSGTGKCTVTLTNSTAVTATFNLLTSAETLSVTLAGSGLGTVTSAPAGINCGSTCSATFNADTSVTLTAAPASGSSFAGWSGACSGTSVCTIVLTENTNVTATFNLLTGSEKLSVTLGGPGTGTVTSSPAGINCGSTCSATYSSGTQVSLTATPSGTSTFTGWGGACSGTSTCTVVMNAATAVTANFGTAANSYALMVQLSGTGGATITSNPAGINCGTVCTGNFAPGTQVTLTTTPTANSYLVNWGGACSGSTTCTVDMTMNESVSATVNLWPINHIVFLAQENRSFDHYFGALRQYWAQNGFPDQSFDGLPQFNPTSGIPPLYGPPPSNPGCNPSDPYQPPPAPFQDCVFDTASPVTSYHLITQCMENPSPSWNEAHVDWDYNDQTGLQPATLNGFVWTAGHDAREMGYYGGNPFYDVNGIRAIGYYDSTDLNYYYFMASNFGTSDRWFNPVLTRTNSNRQYLIAGTSQGYVYPIGSNTNDQKLLTAPTIFQELITAGITWKIYVNPTNSPCTAPYQASCLLTLSYVQDFQWGQNIPTMYPSNIGTIGVANSDFDNDLANGTLPQVVQIEPASDAGLDEHPTNNDGAPSNIQLGANYVAGIINQLMQSQYWKDSAFILTYDEFGGIYDHVSPQPAAQPDGIAPSDLLPTDICYGTPNVGTCNFTYTGYRVPLIVISPYAKKNYVSHTVADTTAILKFIETRFSVPSLTARDSAQPSMSEFFDFNNPPWVTPPTPPTQNTSGPCYVNSLP